MKISTAEKNGVTPKTIETIGLLVAQIPWPSRRQAMAEVTTMLLDGKPRVAEDVFGWSRSTVELGMNELRTGISCVNDLSNRRKQKTEEKYPEMLADIHSIMKSECQADPQLRTTLAYTNMSASAVREALLAKRLDGRASALFADDVKFITHHTTVNITPSNTTGAG